MAICQNCNKNVSDGMAFCPYCGTKADVDQAPIEQAHTAGVKKLHCPQCGSHNITITTESSVSGAVSTHHYGGISSTHVSNTHRNFWMCSDCGAKFRNIQNLEEEIARSKKSPTIFFVLAIIAAVIAIFQLAKSTGILGFMHFSFMLGAAVCAIMFLCLALYCKSNLKKMQAELEYLKKNCF